MSLIQWTPTLSVGVTSFDMQHKELVNMLNDLYDAMRAGKANDVLGEILTRMSGYVLVHFAAEEKLMVKYNYPQYIQHKKEHDDLTIQLKDFKAKFDTGATGLSIQLMTFLKDWLVKHISGSDMQYKEFFLSKGVK